MNKTPIQQAIDLIKKQFAETTAAQGKLAYANTTCILIDLLRTEREVIEEAYRMGTVHGDINDSDTYFTTKFNTNEPTKIN